MASIVDDINEIAEKEGFKNAEDFFCFYTMSGYRPFDIVLHMVYAHSYHCTRNNINNYFGKNIRAFRKQREIFLREDHSRLRVVASYYGFKNIGTYIKWSRKTHDLGYRSLAHAIADLRGIGVTYKKIAEVYCVKYNALRRRLNPVLLKRIKEIVDK